MSPPAGTESRAERSASRSRAMSSTNAASRSRSSAPEVVRDGAQRCLCGRHDATRGQALEAMARKHFDSGVDQTLSAAGIIGGALSGRYVTHLDGD